MKERICEHTDNLVAPCFMFSQCAQRLFWLLDCMLIQNVGLHVYTINLSGIHYFVHVHLYI